MILLPESSTNNKLSFLAAFNSEVNRSISPALIKLYLIYNNLKLSELAISVASLLKLSLDILLLEMFSLSNFGLWAIKLQRELSQSPYAFYPILLYSTMICLILLFLRSASKMRVNPSDEMSLLLIYNDSTLPCDYRKTAKSLAPWSPINRSLTTILVLSLKG